MSKNKNRRKYNKINKCEKCGNEDFTVRERNGRYAIICAYCGYFKRWANSEEQYNILGVHLWTD